MLHAALIGFPSSGKSTLFQLMTSAKDAPRGKGDTAVGISKVPDPRLDKLTAIFNPKKRVPATIEFTDIIAAGRTGAAALVDVAGYKNADALVHVVRAFRDPAVAHPTGSVDPARDAQAMEGSQEEQVGRSRQGEGAARQVPHRARERPAAARHGPGG
jgi:ribosome-binding ATPase YchF (GTP1/OBG family)